MYLVDTNVWLERLLNQAKSDEVGKFLSKVSTRDLYVTDFAFHSICVILLDWLGPMSYLSLSRTCLSMAR